MRPKTLTLRGAAAADTDAFAASQSLAQLSADADGIAQSQVMRADDTPSLIAAVAGVTEDTGITLEPDAAEIIPPARLLFQSTADFSGITFTIVGVDEHGEAIEETFEGPDAGPADDLDGIVDEQALNDPDGLELTLEEAAAALDPARALTFSSGDDLSSVNFVITGLDAYGEAQQVQIAGPNNGEVATTELWSAVTSIEATGTGTGDIDVGWEDVLSRKLTQEHYASVASITPDGTLAEDLDVGTARTDQVMPLTLNGAEGSGDLDPPRRIAITWASS